MPAATRESEPLTKEQAKEVALKAAGPEVQGIYEYQSQRARQGYQPYDDRRMVHVVFRPTGDGRYRCEIRPVEADFERARQNGVDYFHPEHGLLWRGIKKASDDGALFTAASADNEE